MPPGSVRRRRLVEKAIGRDQVTLVCAPAGSGKTIAVADWAANVAAGGEAVAWLTIEDRDDRPYEFWSAVVEALVAALPPETAGRLDALSPPRQGLEPGFVTALTDVLASEPALRWLVLDDVHRLSDPDVLAGIDQLVAQVPAGLGILLVCRTEPSIALHRWRLEGVLGEVRGPDLAFTEAETAELLASLGTSIPPNEVARLVARTEGWAAGLRLAAVSLSATDDTTEFLAAFEGDQRAVADYLFAEIILHLSSDLRDFLVATCAPEQLSIELAAHLSGRVDAGELLDALCRSNALVVQAGDSTWYRYHALLRGYLLAVLGRRDVGRPLRQHARTARWFDEHGEPALALEHAVHSGEKDLLRDLVETNGLRLVLSGQAALVLDVVGSRTRDFADDPEVAIIGALAALDVLDLPAAEEWLPIVEAHGPSSDPRFAALRSSTIVQRALLGGDVPTVLTESGILDLAPTGDPDVDLMVLAYRGPARMRTGDYRGAVDDLERALQVARARRYDQSVLWVLSQLAGMSGTLCDFPSSLDWAQRAIAFASPRGWIESPRLAYAYLLAAWTAFQTGDFAAQARYAESGIRALDGVNNVEVEMGVRSMHALAEFEAGIGRDRYDAAERFHRLWQQPAVDEVSPALVSLATPQEIRLALAVGHTDWALDAVARLERQLPRSAETTMMRAAVMAARGNTQEALKALQPVLTQRVTAHVATTSVMAQVLAAALAAALGNPHRAFECLQESLAWAAPNNYRRPYLDAWPHIEPLLTANRGRFATAEEFVRRLLDDQGPGAHRTGIVSLALTDRESDVLRDLQSVMTLAEIADAQGVTENTVKTHVRAVYQKLGVNSRSAAVREAHTRGLL